MLQSSQKHSYWHCQSLIDTYKTHLRSYEHLLHDVNLHLAGTLFLYAITGLNFSQFHLFKNKQAYYTIIHVMDIQLK